MSTPHAVLAVVADAALRGDVDRVAAAAGVTVVHAAEPSSRAVWTAATAVILDAAAALRCAERALPRRAGVVLVGHTAPGATEWQIAMSVGAQHVMALPAQDADLVTELADATERHHDERRRGPVAAVIAGRGGGGASLFATALAMSAADALLVDADPWGGGIDLVLGAESEPGVRWADLTLQAGRLSYPALRDALPRRHGLSVLSGGRAMGDIAPGPLAAVIEAGARGGVTVVCDTPRRSTAAVETALDAADLVVLITPADVRSCAASAAIVPWIAAVNPNVGMVVRGPAPGGLRSSDVTRIVGVPLLAAMRPQPRIAETLDSGGLRLGRRSPLAAAARRVLSVLAEHPAPEVAA